MKKNILHIIPSISAGGIESLVVALYENIDRDKVHFDIAAFNPNDPIHKDRLEELGANVYFIADAGSKNTIISKILWRIDAVRNYKKLIWQNDYDAIHCHNFNNYGSYIILAALKRIPIRIVHSHTAGGMRENNLTKILRRIKNTISLEFLITEKIGCSDLATKWLYGNDSIDKKRARTIYNGVNMDKFNPNHYNKEELKKKYEFKEGKHFINIGRFSTPKNQFFLIDIFDEMSKIKDNVFLHIVGFGPYEDQLKKKVKNLNLDNKVYFYKRDANVPELLSIIDFFLLPSLWEGFPVTALEAQAANVPIFISDTVTKEVDMGLAVYLPIDKGAKFWGDEIINSIDNDSYPKKIDKQKKELFDIRNIAKQFESLYSSLNK